MGIKGFQGTSLLDFPGRIASLIFFGGCNLTCPFCHNPSLVLDPEQYPDIPMAALLEELQGRRSFIDGVVVTGGEPTLHRDLLPFLREVKALGLQVKLDTNGLAPAVLEQALSEGTIDYLALDLKTSPVRYGELHGAAVCVDDLLESVRLILDSPVESEFRTTCVPGFVEEADVRRIGEAIRGARHWVFQQFLPGPALEPTLRERVPHPSDKILSFSELGKGYVQRVSARGL